MDEFRTAYISENSEGLLPSLCYKYEKGVYIEDSNPKEFEPHFVELQRLAPLYDRRGKDYMRALKVHETTIALQRIYQQCQYYYSH